MIPECDYRRHIPVAFRGKLERMPVELFVTLPAKWNARIVRSFFTGSMWSSVRGIDVPGRATGQTCKALDPTLVGYIPCGLEPAFQTSRSDAIDLDHFGHLSTMARSVFHRFQRNSQRSMTIPTESAKIPKQTSTRKKLPTANQGSFKSWSNISEDPPEVVQHLERGQDGN